MEQCVRMTRAAWRERVRAQNEPPRLTAGEEALNAVSHGLGAALAVAGLVLLLLRSDTPLKVLASCFYGISMVLRSLHFNSDGEFIILTQQILNRVKIVLTHIGQTTTIIIPISAERLVNTMRVIRFVRSRAEPHVIVQLCRNLLRH